VPRLFVGIDFPQELKLDLSKLCAGVPGAKWVRPCKFHLTLRFIGAVDDPTATNIPDALLRIEASSFMLSLAGVGHFGGHTLWVGVEKNPALISCKTRQDRGPPPADRAGRRYQALFPTRQTGTSEATPQSASVSDKR
jgi:2'-5' RNA ligase